MIKSWENLHTSIPHNSSQTILREYDHFHEDRGHAKLLPQLRDPLLMYLVPTATCNMIKMLRFNAAMFVMCRQWLTDNIVFSSARSWGHQQTSLYNSEIKYSNWVKLVIWLATFNQNALFQNDTMLTFVFKISAPLSGCNDIVNAPSWYAIFFISLQEPASLSNFTETYLAMQGWNNACDLEKPLRVRYFIEV